MPSDPSLDDLANSRPEPSTEGSVSPGFDPEPYAAGIRRRNRAEVRQRTLRAERARQEAKRLAWEFHTADVKVTRVYLFGSLSGTGPDGPATPSRPDFDIDLAIVGGDVYRAMEVAERSEWPVDVVQFDRLPSHVRQRIAETGIVLFEAEGL